MPQLLTIKETAEFLRISEKKVYELIHSIGTAFPVIVVGRQYRCSLDSLIKWIESNEQIR